MRHFRMPRKAASQSNLRLTQFFVSYRLFIVNGVSAGSQSRLKTGSGRSDAIIQARALAQGTPSSQSDDSKLISIGEKQPATGEAEYAIPLRRQ
jgi:hypothetical protein